MPPPSSDLNDPNGFPDRIVTFLLSDIVGSTPTVQSMSRQSYEEKVLRPYLNKMRDLVTHHNGHISGTPEGDSMLAAFRYANDALDCAIAIHDALSALTFLDNAGQTRTQKVRISVHTSHHEVTPDENGLYLQEKDVIYAARVRAITHAEQIIVSAEARKRCDAKRWQWKEWHNRRVKDWHTPETLHELLYDGVERKEPGTQFLPDWFREKNQYISRPVLEKDILNAFQKKTPDGVPARLVTLHGFGGMGKTRLAMQCCVQAASFFAGRLYCAKLDTFSEGTLSDEKAQLELLTGSIASAFGLVNNPHDPTTPENLPDRLPDDACLLLLDNYETVAVTLCADLVRRLLEARPDLFIIVTGREIVGSVAWEFPKPIAGLEPPLARKLLIARVCQIRGEPKWKPGQADETAIERLLTLTDGIPLALELVAAHARNSSLTELATSLGREEKEALGEVMQAPGKAVMGDGSDRHQSLENCLNWSWKLLTLPGAQEALMVLSLFTDDCPNTEIKECFPAITTARLAAVQNAALSTRREDKETGISYYSLLRPTRAYARARLKEADTDNALQNHFVAFYRQVVQENGGSDNQEDVTMRMRLYSAWRQAMAAGSVAATMGDAESCAAIAAWLMHFVMRQALWNDALPFFRQAQEFAANTLPDGHPGVAQSLNNLAMLYQDQGRYDESEPLLVEALNLSKASLPDGHPQIATSLNNLASLYQDQGRYDEAEPLYVETVGIMLHALGSSHPNMRVVFDNLLGFWQEQNRTDALGPLLESEPALAETLAWIRAQASSS